MTREVRAFTCNSNFVDHSTANDAVKHPRIPTDPPNGWLFVVAVNPKSSPATIYEASNAR